MEKLKKNLRDLAINTLIVLGSIFFIFVLLEIVCRLLPIALSPPVQLPTPENSIQRYVKNSPFTWSQGWNLQNVVHGHSNAQGFIADYDYSVSAASPVLAIIGDSFIEALMVNFPETITGRLQHAYGADARVYSFAQSGSQLSQYIAYAKYACAAYQPRRMVINIVGNDFDESVYDNRMRSGIFHLHSTTDGFESILTPVTPTGHIEKIAHHSAFVLYLLRNVSLRNIVQQVLDMVHASTSTRSYVGNTDADAGPERIAEGEKVIAWFFEELSNSMCLPPIDIVIVVDAMRPQIYDPAQLSAARMSYFGQMRTKVLTTAAATGFTVIDLEQPFLEAFAKDQRRFEFLIDAHWSAHGHAVVAEAVKTALVDWPPQ